MRSGVDSAGIGAAVARPPVRVGAPRAWTEGARPGGGDFRSPKKRVLEMQRARHLEDARQACMTSKGEAHCQSCRHEMAVNNVGPDAIDLARDRKHSTMEDAARVAKEAGAEKLIATHFSSRYDGRQIVQIADEAREVFENITTGKDLLEIEL